VKVAVLGAGLMGSEISIDLARSRDVDKVVLCDVDEGKLAEVKRRSGGRKLETEMIDVSNVRKASKFLAGFDVASSALPHGIVAHADKAAITAGVNTVNIAFEDVQMNLDGLAKKKGVTFIPGCGLAPGLSAILAAHASRSMNKTHEVHIAVGGIPQKPTPPFGYKLVFSMRGLLREYLTSARVIRDGKVKTVSPFEKVEEIEFAKPIGKCEMFCTDGLATLLYSMKGVREMDEKTVRWPGHVEKMKLLVQAGFFRKEPISVGGVSLSPYDFSSAVLMKVLTKGDEKDVTVMRVEVVGTIKDVDKKTTFELIDYFDEKKKVTSMARTTGYTCAIVTRMVGRGEIRRKGVIPPEAALGDELVRKLLRQLASKGVLIKARTAAAG
jgi:lysine 6-dehydrogenase